MFQVRVSTGPQILEYCFPWEASSSYSASLFLHLPSCQLCITCHWIMVGLSPSASSKSSVTSVSAVSCKPLPGICIQTWISLLWSPGSCLSGKLTHQIQFLLMIWMPFHLMLRHHLGSIYPIPRGDNTASWGSFWTIFWWYSITTERPGLTGASL